MVILTIVFCGTSRRLIDHGFRLYLGCGFRPPWSFRGHSTVNTIGKDAVLPCASAQIVSGGTVGLSVRQMTTYFVWLNIDLFMRKSVTTEFCLDAAL